jgi:carboxypeptidase C (cathepsin A)
VGRYWDAPHTPPDADQPVSGILNVMPDLASAMKYDPDLKIMVNGGYFDLATPYFEGWYEDHHLQIPDKLQNNIEYHYYQSGHMVYVHVPSLKLMHDNVAAFINRTDNLSR